MSESTALARMPEPHTPIIRPANLSASQRLASHLIRLCRYLHLGRAPEGTTTSFRPGTSLGATSVLPSDRPVRC